MNMASNFDEDSVESRHQKSDSEDSSSGFSESDSETASESGSSSGNEAVRHTTAKICKSYNHGRCHYGDKCWNLHICLHYAKGNCHYGAGCRLNHITSSSSSPRQSELPGRKNHGRRRRRSRSPSPVENDGDNERPYRWQLDIGRGWEDVAHDYILEAQYSRPNTKGIKIYNTSAGAISIDFTKMRVLKKTNIRVRRKGSEQTEWLWWYQGDQGWYRYGEKGSKGKASPLQSSKLEQEYQKNRKGSVQFSVDSTNYEVNFRGMSQKNLSTGHSRRVRRRPKYEPQSGVELSLKFKNLMTPPNKAPIWQFEGKSGGNWHTFKNSGGCSVSSADIERCYKQQQKTMTFSVNGDTYILDFSRMNQVNQRTNAKRKIQRV
ncbi:protein mono-ADP-ribosyltransferase PARP12-like [Myxocyprinus asiaticus]|uniref:protein mono-ADP-ribosyltransferase PARP12-like n=1 Tax=Myxocyprinus asiaticus TaxID=70543 RepID=UPI002221D639|nr:protein mono-ADP-ribosyltransferase PARP12-like [Myxocyprinus asiaticus]